MTAKQLIHKYQLLPHPEGGYYRETYRSVETIDQQALPARFGGVRNFSTAIYFLLEQGNFSAFHRISADECWHFYGGGSLMVHIINVDGQLQTIRMGNNMEAEEHFQYVVPAGCWFASEPAEGVDFSFVGCTVAPGFDFNDFELVKAERLAGIYPHHGEIIERLCR